MNPRMMLLVGVFGLLMPATNLAQEIPAGTVLPVMMSSDLNSAKAKPGDKLCGKLMQTVILASGERIPAGAPLEGQVVEVAAASANASARLVVRFDQLIAGQKQFGISVSLRALASMGDVFAAQLPWSTFDDYGTSSSDWNTVQVGGAAVYRGDGTVRSAMEVIGHATDSGAVTAKLLPDVKRGCAAEPTGSAREQSLWVFSPWACGTYGFEDLTIARGGSRPMGTIELTAPKEVRVRGGSGWLLQVVEARTAGAGGNAK